MKNLKAFDIQFSGLKLGEHQFDFEIDEKFFAHFGYEEFEKAELIADVIFVKKENQLELNFTVSGRVWLYCDICRGDAFSLPKTVSQYQIHRQQRELYFDHLHKSRIHFWQLLLAARYPPG